MADLVHVTVKGVEPLVAVNRRALVGILVVGGGLALASVVLPGVLLPTWWARAITLSTACFAWVIAIWIARAGVTTSSLFVTSIWGDAAIVAGALVQQDPVAARTSVVMFALTSGIVALLGSATMMSAQGVAVAVGVVTMMADAGLAPAAILVQGGAALLATLGPGLLVLMIRRSLDEALARERDLASTDPLTRTANRRGFETAIPSMVRRADTAALPIGLALIDIDHFKQVNDRLGHRAGDEVLQEVADVIRGCVRDGDLVCRLGGEEFAILAAIAPDDLAALGERIRGAVESRWTLNKVTVSVGAAWTAIGDGETSDPTQQVWALLDRADELMYYAKANGRNQMRVQAEWA